jgi:hypothetical protein
LQFSMSAAMKKARLPETSRKSNLKYFCKASPLDEQPDAH